MISTAPYFLKDFLMAKDALQVLLLCLNTVLKHMAKFTQLGVLTLATLFFKEKKNTKPWKHIIFNTNIENIDQD